MDHLDRNEADEKLRAEFTRFLETMVRRAKINYLTKYRQRAEIISLDEVPEQAQPTDEIRLSNSQTEFEFEEERLANAFSTLPLMRRKILQLLFVEELTPQEIAKRMNCSVGHVYNQRSLALKKLRNLLEDGEMK